VLLPEEEPASSQVARALAEFLVMHVQRERGAEDARDRAGILIAAVNGIPVAEHPLARFLLDAGFQSGRMGFNVRRSIAALPSAGPGDVTPPASGSSGGYA